MDVVSVVRKLFFENLTYREIVLQLFLQLGVEISLRQLKRLLKELGLRRRKNYEIPTLMAAVETELRGSGGRLGCRMMVHRLLGQHGISVGRDTVLKILHLLDPEGIELRKKHRLSRRVYVNKGPNYLVHIDGYDKLKKYGFAIHGAICGYSRKVLWLKVARSNNDPQVIASYFLEYVKEIQGVPRCIRVDAGTENVIMNDLQTAFRSVHNDDVSERSVIVGSSHFNQRIESWWRLMRQLGVGYWIDHFSDLEASGGFSSANPFHIECFRFCFTQLIQADLLRIQQEWNEHRVRGSTPDSPAGKPYMLYHFPELTETRDYKLPVDLEDVNILETTASVPSKYGCLDPDIFLSVMNEERMKMPENCEQASYADLFVFNGFESVFDVYKVDVLESEELLKAHRERVASLPRIAEWLKKRPVSEF